MERRLFVEGFLLRYDTHTRIPAMTPVPEARGTPGVQLLAGHAYVLLKRVDDARRLFEPTARIA